MGEEEIQNDGVLGDEDEEELGKKVPPGDEEVDEDEDEDDDLDIESEEEF